MRKNDIKTVYSECKGHLALLSDLAGVVVGYSDRNDLIAAFPPLAGTTWEEEELEASRDFVEEQYKGKGYTFYYVKPENVIGYKPPKKVRVLTFKELQDNPKVKLIVDDKHCVIRVNHEDNELSIVKSMFCLLGTEIELIPSTEDGGYKHGMWAFEPWMYKEC